MFRFILQFVSILLAPTLIFVSCKKEKFITDSKAKLTFSNDTVYFDTVFTQIGSATQILQIYNPYKEPIKINSIRLAGGNQSVFRINVDGLKGSEFYNIPIKGKDSLWIFLQVTLNPTNQNNPLVIQDKLIFEVNGNIQTVTIIAWGQDAIYYRADTRIKGLPPFKILPTDATGKAIWKKDKPIVIFDYLVVDSAQQLIIEAGTKIHFYTKTSGLWVYKYGNIKVNGTKDEPVIFQGGRLEPSYKEIPGQWDRIWINEGNDSCEFNYTIIKNSFIGIQAEVLSDGFATNKLKLNNVFIRNITGFGLLTRFFNVTAINTIITNTGNNSLALTFGGKYKFIHCTFNNYWNYENRKNPSVLLNNYSSVQVLPFNATFINCIIYGDKENELTTAFKAGADTTTIFSNCLIKQKAGNVDINNSQLFTNCIFNRDPLLKNKNYDVKLNAGSPCINAGTPIGATIAPLDFDGILRDNTPDIGAYEFTP
jgi:hypothetical protein